MVFDSKNVHFSIHKLTFLHYRWDYLNTCLILIPLINSKIFKNLHFCISLPTFWGFSFALFAIDIQTYDTHKIEKARMWTRERERKGYRQGEKEREYVSERERERERRVSVSEIEIERERGYRQGDIKN